MDFVTLKVTCPEELSHYLISELFQIGFDSFQELDDGFEGSCESSSFDEKRVNEILSAFSNLSFEIKEQDKINWNEEWEKNYEPIIVEDRCIVRASFHDSRPEFEYELIVTPKMSFGTGHHATTYQVLAYQMQLDHTNKTVLDVGTGTGILAIMAKKRGASKTIVTDIDEWCIENSEENFGLNHVRVDKILKAQINQVEEHGFDIIIANINKNVLLEQIGEYAKRLKEGGQLLLSGFYKKDISDLEAAANENQLQKITSTTKDNWAMLVVSKQSV